MHAIDAITTRVAPAPVRAKPERSPDPDPRAIVGSIGSAARIGAELLGQRRPDREANSPVVSENRDTILSTPRRSEGDPRVAPQDQAWLRGRIRDLREQRTTLGEHLANHPGGFSRSSLADRLERVDAALRHFSQYLR